MAEYNGRIGVWRTIGGRRIFIREKQSLPEAMKESNKFKIKMNKYAIKGARDIDLKEQYMQSLNDVSRMEYLGQITRDEYDKAIADINREYKKRVLK